MQTDGVT